MIRTLVSLDADLASSIALRYACHLANIIEMDLNTMHVEEADRQGTPPGSGWVRRTWENALLKSGEAEIGQLIQAERLSYPALRAPKMMVGDREDEILHEIQKESYDLFVEGALHTFTAANFYNKIRSKLYRYTPCPTIMVKNLVKLEKMVIVFDEEAEFKRLVGTFLKIFKRASIKLDLMHYQFRESAETPSNSNGDADTILHNAKETLTEAGEGAANIGVLHPILKGRKMIEQEIQSAAKAKLADPCTPQATAYLAALKKKLFAGN